MCLPVQNQLEMFMSQTLLERSVLPDLDPDKLVNQSVLEYAEKQLGYKHPEQDRNLSRGKLALALRAMGLKPFTPASVDHYKKTEVRRLQPQGCLIVFAQLGDMMSGFLFCMVMLSSFLFSGHVVTSMDTTTGFFKALPHWSTSMFVLSFIFFTMSHHALQKDATSAEWKLVPIKDYKSPVPEFALATAMEIHQRLPEAELMIDELVVTKRDRTPRSEDPFLVLTFNKEKYWVEVWKEPGYRQERMA
jgi:hypothetical protein